jgi:hypothetical protein
MNLLMAEEVYELEIAVGIPPTLFSRLPMMHVEVLLIEEGFLTVRTDPVLALGELLLDFA